MYSNNYLNGYGYNQFASGYPYYSQYTQTTQVTQPQQAPMSSQPTNTNQIFVNGIEDVRNRAVPPNSSFIFTDNDKPILYEKSVDSKGQFEIKTFKILEITGQEGEKQAGSINSSDFVKTGEFEALKEEFKKLESRLTKFTVQKEIESIRSDKKNSGGGKQ